MTENKRYTTDNGSNEDVCLVDNVTGKEFESDFDEIVDLLNEQDKRINRLENYIKSDFIGSVCDNCKHVKAYHTSNWFCGMDEDIECLKGHEDMDIDDCIDFEIDLGRYE